MSVTGTTFYLVVNLHAPAGLKQSHIGKGNLYDPRNQTNAINSLCAKEKQHWVSRVLNNLPGTKFLPHVILFLRDSETGWY